MVKDVGLGGSHCSIGEPLANHPSLASVNGFVNGGLRIEATGSDQECQICLGLPNILSLSVYVYEYPTHKSD